MRCLRKGEVAVTGFPLVLKSCKVLKFCCRIFKFWGEVCPGLSVAEVICPDPKTESFDTEKQCVSASLLPTKLSFFLSVADIVNPFLTTYQTDKPMQ